MPTAHPGQPAYSSPQYDSPPQYGSSDPYRDYTSGIAHPGQPSYPGQGPISFDPPSIEEYQAVIDEFGANSYRNTAPVSFNPYDMGLGSYFNSVWATALEKAKQESTMPKTYTYEKPSPAGSGGNSGMGGVVGWFKGIPEYFINLREQDKIEWIEHKKKLEVRRESTKNPEGQEVISDADVNDPWVSFLGASGEPSAEPSAVEKIGNTWDEFAGAVVEGWEEGGIGGIGDYKYPLLIAGGAILLILLIK